MTSSRLLSVAALALLLAASPVRAQLPEEFTGTTDPADLPAVEPWNEPDRVESGGNLSAKVGIGLLITLDFEVTRVVLADDEVARVQVISPREVLLTGLEPGRTSIHVWLDDGSRLFYTFQALRDLDLLRRTLADLDPRIEVNTSPDGLSVVLEGEVAAAGVAGEALSRARAILAAAGDRTEPLSLLRYPGSSETLDDRLREALAAIDPRIRVRRIQVGDLPEAEQDTFVLEGRVRDIHALKRAVTLAERQLGGTGSELIAAGDDRLRFQRFRGFTGTGVGGGSDASTGLLQNTTEAPAAGLSAKVARRLVVTSESGRVVSFLEVDELPQVLVSIRVVEVDRTKAKKAGINFRFDNGDLSIGNFLSPQASGLPPGSDGGVASIAGVGGTNIVAAFVNDATSILTAIDFLEDKALARSVAEPNILTLTGEPATVVVGGEVPVPTTAVNQVTAVQGFFFQDFGVRLDIRPTVVEDDLIALEVLPSIVRRNIALGVGDVPGFQVQSVQTTTRMQTGQSLVLGGLLSFEEGLEQRKLPGFGWLPGLGRWRRKTRSERELLFIISPRIVATPRGVSPPEPLEMPDLAAVELPELEWPDGRRRWRDEFEPPESRPDGVPPSFLDEPYVEQAAPPAEPVWTAEPGPFEAEPFEAEPFEAEPFEVDTVPVPAGSAPEPIPELSWNELEPEAEVGEPAGAESWVVAADPCLNLRAEPGMSSPALDCLASGVTVEILGEKDGWTRVRLADGRQGWVTSDYLRPVLPGESPPDESQLDQLTSERDVLRERLDAAETADEELEDQLRAIQEEIERIRAESGG